jgi:hypothetical protein
MKILRRDKVLKFKINNIFHIEDDNVVLDDEISEFLEESLLSNMKSITEDEGTDAIIVCFEFDEKDFEYYINNELTLPQYKTILKALNSKDFKNKLKERIEEVCSKKGYTLTVHQVDVEYSPNSFHTMGICSKD